MSNKLIIERLKAIKEILDSGRDACFTGTTVGSHNAWELFDAVSDGLAYLIQDIGEDLI